MDAERSRDNRQAPSRGWRTARKVGVSVVGGSMVAIGVPLLVLPGPGLLMIGGGLAVLANEFPVARRALNRAMGRSGVPDETPE